MRNHKYGARLMAAVLILAAVLSVCPVSWAAERVVRIGSLEDLRQLTTDCGADSYSDGLQVVLTRDIQAGGAAVSIPVFLGTFDGGGHKISGVRLNSGDSRLGLFGRLERGAVVKNLQVEAEVVPSGTQDRIGGLVGENYGHVENCGFSGIVAGNSQVGGIAGINETGGVLQNCQVTGVIRGKQSCGGIAGKNSGTILSCVSSANVNTTLTEQSVTEELGSLDSKMYNILKDAQTTTISTATGDIGGIAGYSSGVVQGCENKGEVGYAHVGYNVGGIAGRQKGYLTDCVNSGRVLGRKDVGGIVGQMEPDITVQASGDSLEQMQDALNQLQSAIDKTLDDVQASSDDISGSLDRTLQYAQEARESTSRLTDALAAFTDDNIEAVNGLVLMTQRYLGKLSPVLDDLADASDSLRQAMEALNKALERVEDASVYTQPLLEKLAQFCQESRRAGEALQNGAQTMKEAFELLGQEADIPDLQPLQTALSAFLQATDQLSQTCQTALEEYQQTGKVSQETAQQLQKDLQAALGAWSAVAKEWNQILQQVDFGQLLNQSLETLRQFAKLVQKAMTQFSEAAQWMDKALATMEEMALLLEDANKALDGLTDRLQESLDKGTDSTKALASAFDKASEWAEALSQEEPPVFSSLGDEARDSADDLNQSLTGMGNQLSRLNESASGAISVLTADVRAINTQFMTVMNLFLTFLEDTQNLDYTNIYEDVSEESLKSAVEGKVQDCVNEGVVEADRNAGGIAGAMAIEYDLDPEDDQLSDRNKLFRFKYETRAVLLNCRNHGQVTAKRSCAGGVTGRMDVGTIYGCGGFGDTVSESGEYAGGVCGLSLCSIRSSFAKCTLSGGSYVGGIAGSGNRIYDCVAMVEVADAARMTGAIAGEVTGEYAGNRFVSDTLAGVDRISYSGKAELAAYKDLEEEGILPEEMRTFTLRFLVDEKEKKSLTFSYGASFDASVAPEIPAKEGFYGRWDREDLTNLTFDTVVRAAYTPCVTAIASEARRQAGRPVFYAEGAFTAGNLLRVQEKRLTDAGAKQTILDAFSTMWRLRTREVLESWQLTVPEDGNAAHKIHYLPPEGTGGCCALFLLGDGQWRKADTEAFGSYLVFETEDLDVELAAVTLRPMWIFWLPLLGAVLLLLGGILGLLVRRIRRRKAGGGKKPAKKLRGGSPAGRS